LLIKCGFDIAYECAAATPMLLTLHIRPERIPDLQTSENFAVWPAVPYRNYRDGFGNICTRLVAPAGTTRFTCDFLIGDSGLPDSEALGARQSPVEELPDGILLFLLGSRYCDTEKLADLAWSMFRYVEPGWPRVRAISQYTHNRISFGYRHARRDRTAFEGHQEGVGVCRDFAHLAIALCRCMNIPARYCTGYLGDIGVPVDSNPMDFSAWFEVYLGGTWHIWDARHDHPRIGRIPVAQGRDATDAAISTAFGAANLINFAVVTEEIRV
jgi:transglutaminase-like putative cysteine protease